MIIRLEFSSDKVFVLNSRLFFFFLDSLITPYTLPNELFFLLRQQGMHCYGSFTTGFSTHHPWMITLAIWQCTLSHIQRWLKFEPGLQSGWGGIYICSFGHEHRAFCSMLEWDPAHSANIWLYEPYDGMQTWQVAQVDSRTNDTRCKCRSREARTAGSTGTGPWAVARQKHGADGERYLYRTSTRSEQHLNYRVPYLGIYVHIDLIWGARNVHSRPSYERNTDMLPSRYSLLELVYLPCTNTTLSHIQIGIMSSCNQLINQCVEQSQVSQAVP